MHPVLIKIPIFGGLTIHTYGVMVALGFVLGILWIVHESKRVGLEPSKMLDLIFYVIIAGIVGSRVFYVAISQRSEFLADPLVILKMWRGGLVFYGGLISSVIVSFFFIRKHKLPVLLTIDIFAPAIAIGHAVGRIGCLMAGCCYGKELSHAAWYGITFPDGVGSFAPPGIELFPTQLFESFGEIVIFCLLMLVRKFKKFDGQLISVYIILYAILRYVNELFRGDQVRGFLIDPWLSTSQAISIALFVLGVFMYLKLWRRAASGNRGI